MGNLVLTGSTSGSTTIQPTDAVTAVITLPSTTGTVALTSGASAFTNLTVTNDATISGLTVGKGAGAGPNNTAVGYQTLQASNSGIRLASFGYQTLYSNTTGSENSAFGFSALAGNTTGSYHTAYGSQALLANTTASYNTAVGYQAGYNSNRTADTAGFHTFLGYQAGLAVTVGTSNTMIGAGAGSAITSGSYNTILGGYNGNQGGLDIRTSSQYIVLSDGAGNPRLYSNASGNICIGTPTSPASNLVVQSSSGTSAASFYAEKAAGTASDFIYFYSLNKVSLLGYIGYNGSIVTYNATSDYRLKDNVAPMTSALEKISLLKPCTYTWKSNNSNGHGFIAHELAEIFPDAVSGEKDQLFEDGTIKPQGIDTSVLVATLTAAIQELNAKVTALEAQLGAK